jgi:SAM-dependent methyltransferase
MATWSDGYFTDIQYTSQYYPEMAPGYLAMACLRQGVRPPALGPGASYLELGCGQGYGLNLLAAANPSLAFHGVDFHPGQIDNARRLARAAGLSNIVFEDMSFEQMLALPEGRPPRFDVVALHGVYSWVSPQNRAFIVQILDRFVKPGGMVYVSYNCLPGWAPLIPLQRFIADHVARSGGDPQVAVVKAVQAAQQMLDAKAGYFESVPHLRARIAEAQTQNPAYLVHEFLNAHSHPFFHAEVAQELAGARLGFAASANLADDLIKLAVPAPLQGQIQEAGDRTWRETLMDYGSNKPFRRDIFVRGVNRLGRPEREALLNATRLALLTPPEAVSLDFPIPIGGLKGAPTTYGPIIEALAEGPRTYGELAALPNLAGLAEGALIQAITLLTGARQIHPLPEFDAGFETATAFNRAVLARTAFDEHPHHLASGLTGTAVRVEFAELAALHAAATGQDDPAAAARQAWPQMARTGRRLLKDGQALADQGANEAELTRRISDFNRNRLPQLRSLGVI